VDISIYLTGDKFHRIPGNTSEHRLRNRPRRTFESFGIRKQGMKFGVPWQSPTVSHRWIQAKPDRPARVMFQGSFIIE